MAKGVNFNDSPITHVNNGGVPLKILGATNGPPDQSSATIGYHAVPKAGTGASNRSPRRKQRAPVKRLINGSKRRKNAVRRKKKHSVAKKDSVKALKTVKRRRGVRAVKQKVDERDITDIS